jgi:hypothetical protein
LNEIGDSKRGQYMLGQLAQKRGEDRPLGGRLGKMRKDKESNPIFNYADKKQKKHKLRRGDYVSGMNHKSVLDTLNNPDIPRDEKLKKMAYHRVDTFGHYGPKLVQGLKPLDDATDDDLYDELKRVDDFYFPVKESKESFNRIIKESLKQVLNEGKCINNKPFFTRGGRNIKPGQSLSSSYFEGNDFLRQKGYKDFFDAYAAVRRGELDKNTFDKWYDKHMKAVNKHNDRLEYNWGEGNDDNYDTLNVSSYEDDY